MLPLARQSAQCRGEGHGNSAFAAQWAGEAVRLSRAMPAAELVATLVQETVDAITSLQTGFGICSGPDTSRLDA
jgi:nitronate monooxygenase